MQKSKSQCRFTSNTLELTIDGKRLEFSTKKFVKKPNGPNEVSKMKGTTSKARSINILICKISEDFRC
jgi:hypothetical protein